MATLQSFDSRTEQIVWRNSRARAARAFSEESAASHHAAIPFIILQARSIQENGQGTYNHMVMAGQFEQGRPVNAAEADDITKILLQLLEIFQPRCSVVVPIGPNNEPRECFHMVCLTHPRLHLRPS